MFDRGVFTISVDFELAWGTFDSGKHHMFEEVFRARGEDPFEGSRRIMTGLMDVLARWDVPSTFATVGALFLDHLTDEGRGKHPEMPRPHHAWFPRDWYDEVPFGDERSAPLWYGRDLVLEVARSPVGHDLGSHSFSHAIFDDPGCPREVAVSEVRRCVELSRAMGVVPRSFVFPRNRVGHLDVLVEEGFTVTRDPAPFWYLRLPGKLTRKGAHILDDGLALTPDVGLPHRLPEGLWSVPCSMFLQSMDGVRRLLPAEARVLKAMRGLDRAARERAMFHLTFHCVNLFHAPEAMLRVLSSICEHMARLRDRGAIEVLTMAGAAARAEAASG